MLKKQLNVKNLNKLDSTLKEVFGMSFDFAAGNAKLSKVKTVTEQKIKALRESGVEVNNKQYQKLLLVLEGINTAMENTPVMENELDQAEVLLAAKNMADDLQKMAENLASMQVEELMSITNAMKEEVGTAEADTFNASAEAAIGSALEAVKTANEQYSLEELLGNKGFSYLKSLKVGELNDGLKHFLDILQRARILDEESTDVLNTLLPMCISGSKSRLGSSGQSTSGETEGVVQTPGSAFK